MTRKTNLIETSRESVDFGMTDERGRAIGAFIKMLEADFVESDNGCGFHKVSPGHKFIVEIQATRNGKGFGACQPENVYDTAELRQAAIETRLASMKKRYSKTPA